MLQRKNKSYAVELLGLPGAGKTTLARHLRLEYGLEEVGKHPSRREMSFAILLQPIFFLRWAILILPESFKTGTKKLIRYKFALLANMIAMHRRSLKQGELVILDEGFLQRLLSTLEEKKDISYMRRKLKNMPLGNQIIIVEAQEPSFQRYIGSDHIRASLGSEYMELWKEIISHNYRMLIEAINDTHIPYSLYRTENDLENIRTTLKNNNHDD